MGKRVGIAVLAVCLASAGLFATGIIGLNFAGVDLSADPRQLTPPDTMGAVGPNHIVEFINGAFAVYNKTTGALIGSVQSDSSFWTSTVGLSSSTLGTSGLTDTRIQYDPGSGRWFATELTTDSTGNKLLLGISQTSDPTGAWKGTSFTANAGFGDFDTLGVDSNAVYIGTNNFTDISGAGGLQSVSLFSIPKSDLTGGSPTTAHMTSFADLSTSSGYGFSLQGVNNWGATTAGTVLAQDLSSASQLDAATITGPGGAGAVLSSPTGVAVGTIQPEPLAFQPDGTRQIDGSDARIMSRVWQVGNLIYEAQETGVGTGCSFEDSNTSDTSCRLGIRVSVLNATTLAEVAEGVLSEAGADYIYPSLAVDSLGNIVLGFTRSCGTGTDPGPCDPSAYAELAKVVGSNVVFTDTLPLAIGAVGDYHLLGTTPERWGDFSSTVPDPSNPNVFWTFQETAAGQFDWGTQITEIILPEPATAATALAGLAILWLVRRRRRG